jgi:hypothetical protein
MNKQETLEEVAERIAHNFEEPSFKAGVVYGIIEGAKWQQEQDKNKYSEEEVLKILKSLVEHPTKPGYKRRDIVKFIEQFKNK